MQQRIEQNTKALKVMDATMGVHTRKVGNYQSALTEISGSLLGFSTGAGAALAILTAFKTAFTITETMDRYDAALKAVSRDTSDFVRSQSFLISLANKLGSNYGVLVGSYNKLKAATRDTALEGRETEHIFRSIATAGAKLNLSNEAVEGSLRAISKMVSSGNVQMDELRSELGEHLPGALRILGEALGVSQSKLNKMVETGQILAVDVLPKLATGYDKAFGLKQGEQIETITASTNRMTTSIQLLVSAMADSTGIRAFWKAISDGLSTSLGDIRRFIADGSVKELFTVFGAGSLTRRNQQRATIEQKTAEFGQLEGGQRQLELGSLLDQEHKARMKGDIDRANELSELHSKLRRVDLKLTLAEMQENGRKQIIAEKEAIGKNETDLTRFQKQSALKRTAEIISLEKKLAKDTTNVVLQEKIKQYTRLNDEQNKLDAEAKARLKGERKESAEQALNRNLSLSKSNTGVKLSGLDNDKQDGLIDEATYLERRKEITLAGIAERQAILKAAGKRETDDYKDTLADKLDAERIYKRDSMKLALSESSSTTNNALADIELNKQDGDLTEREAVEKKLAVTVGGLRDRQRILAEYGQMETKLYEDTETDILKATATYNRERLAVDKKAWDEALQQTKQSLDATDKLVGENLKTRLAVIDREYRQAQAKVKIAQAGGKISEEAAENRLHTLKIQHIQDTLRATQAALDTEKDATTELINYRISVLELISTDESKTLKERKEAEKAIGQLRIELEKRLQKIRTTGIDEVAEAQKDTDEADEESATDKAAKKFERFKQLSTASLQLTNMIGTAIFDRDAQRFEDQARNMEKQKQYELELVGNNEAAKSAIEKKYDDQRKQLQRQQDQQARQKAIFDAIIGTAVAVIQALPNAILAGIAGGLGLAQIAIIQATPLPQYKEGKNVGRLDSYEGKAVAGEAGREIHFGDDGSVNVYDKATVIDVKKDDVILPNRLTEQLLSDSNAFEANRLLHQNRKGIEIYKQTLAYQQEEKANRQRAQTFPVGMIQAEIEKGFDGIIIEQWNVENGVLAKTIINQNTKTKGLRSAHQLKGR